MKYQDENHEWKEIYLDPAGDTLPIGTIVDYDGDTVPEGYELVDDSGDYLKIKKIRNAVGLIGNIVTNIDAQGATDVPNAVTIKNAIKGVLESGSNSNGNWIKYADGTMICYGRTTSQYALNIEYGSVYRADLQSINLPASFINPNYVVNIQGLAPVHFGYVVDNDKAVNLFKFYPVGIVSQSSVQNRSVEYMVIGKWK